MLLPFVFLRSSAEAFNFSFKEGHVMNFDFACSLARKYLFPCVDYYVVAGFAVALALLALAVGF